MADTVDFAVVGRGLWGTACARHLADAGATVALIGPDEPADRLAHTGPFGSFHDAGRITRRIATDPVWALMSSRSIDRYAQIERDSGVTFYTPCGGMMAGPTDGASASFARSFVETTRKLHPYLAVLDATGLAQTVPEYRFSSGTQAVLDPDGGVINPRAMRMAEEILARRAGAKVYRHQMVARADQSLTLADSSILSAGHVVLATGAYANNMPLELGRLAMRVFARTVVFAEVDRSEAARLSAMPSLIFVPDGQNHDLYLLPPIRYPDGRHYLKIGGEADSPRLCDAPALNAWFKSDGSAKVARALQDALNGLMPDLKIQSSHSGACAVAFTSTGYPTIDRITQDVTILAGGNGAGAKCADEVGRLGARMAMGHDLSGEGYTNSFGAVFDPAPAPTP